MTIRPREHYEALKQRREQEKTNERRARRYTRYEQVVQLNSQVWSQHAIAQEVRIHPQTVAISLKDGQFPERALILHAHS